MQPGILTRWSPFLRVCIAPVLIGFYRLITGDWRAATPPRVGQARIGLTSHAAALNIPFAQRESS